MTDPNQPDQPDAHALLLGNYRLSPDVESSNKPHRVDETKRNPFQRDCGRLLHSEAFRYLSGKTQVFMETAPGYFRSRLTHTMEVVQVARSLSTALGSDLFLCEALALAHDLGHPPFGHDGEAALAECVQKATGEVATFDHNNQTLRVVMHLEGFYPYFRGLNLCVGTLVLLANHGQMHVKKPTPADKKTPHAAAREAWNRLKHEMEQKKWDWQELLALPKARLAIAIVDHVDDLTYICHDLDDAIKEGLVSIEEVRALQEVWKNMEGWWQDGAELRTQRGEERALATASKWIARCLLHEGVNELLRLHQSNHSDFVSKELSDLIPWTQTLYKFLKTKVYREASRVAGPVAQEATKQVFNAYIDNINEIPKAAGWSRETHPQRFVGLDLEKLSDADRRRVLDAICVADYIAAQTDQWVMDEVMGGHRRSPLRRRLWK